MDGHRSPRGQDYSSVLWSISMTMWYKYEGYKERMKFVCVGVSCNAYRTCLLHGSLSVFFSKFGEILHFLNL
jgi:hypothetical protein